MTGNHAEFCKELRRSVEICRDAGLAYRQTQEAVDLIESQAARIQQQALEYVSLQAQCDEHLARIAELEREKDEAEKHAAVVSSENFDLEARIAELDRKHKEAWDDCGELNATNHELLAACGEKDRRIAELEKERDALKADGERLDSGCIVTHERDEFGAEYECERRGVDLRARIDAAMEINKRQSERPDWAECESRGPLVRNSLKHRASELTTAANKCRRAYQEDFMRIPLEWLVDAYDEAAAALNRRLSSIAALQAEKEGRDER